MKPTPEFLADLVRGQSVIVDMGPGGKHIGRVHKITDKIIFVRMGKEERRFLRSDGGTAHAATFSNRSWLMPMEGDNA